MPAERAGVTEADVLSFVPNGSTETLTTSEVIQRSPTRADSVLSTLNQDGSRRWLTPRLAEGRFWRRRRATAYLLIAVFTLLPYISIGGYPAVLLDLTTRHFHIFGFTFLPTDTFLLALLMLGTFLSIFLATALLGRVWCGWACPQTVYMEFVYRPLERFFEGSPGRVRKHIQGRPIGKVLKYAAYFVVSCYLAHTFLAYFVGVEQLARWVRQSPLEHPGPFLVMAVVTGLMMFDFSFFREQTCLVACPYGRLQSVLLDKNSMIVSYDFNRGEPRGKGKREPRRVSLPVAFGGGGGSCGNGCAGCGCGPKPEAPVLGDCVDCGMCVQVCPTGIDIRNGLQMECVNCTQCIDACDAVMDKIGRPRGLVRYSSQAALQGGRFSLLRPRVILYPALLAIVATLFSVVLYNKPAMDFLVMRGRGLPFTRLDSDEIANSVQVKLANRTGMTRTYRVSVVSPAGVRIEMPENTLRLEPAEWKSLPALIIAEPGVMGGGTRDVVLSVSSEDGVTRERTFPMLGPGAPGRGPATQENSR